MPAPAPPDAPSGPNRFAPEKPMPTPTLHDPELCQALLRRLEDLLDRPMRFMEVCGTHTVSIFRGGLRTLLPEQVTHLTGPGCPVCVTHDREVAAFLKLAEQPNVIIATFGDLMRVPGPDGRSLKHAQADGARVSVIYSPLDALTLAADNSDATVVFLGVGFETTAPAVAATVLAAEQRKLDNFAVFSCHKLVPPALAALLGDPDNGIDAFLLPGHVSTVLGLSPFRFVAEDWKRPAIVAGFEPADILDALCRMARQYREGEFKVENAYPRAVNDDGNPKARAILSQVFRTADALWRGLGVMPNDEESKHCATLLQWDNIYYQPPTTDYVDKKTTVRVGLVQWQMRPYKTLDDVFEQVEFFVDAVSDYKSDFVLFPEYFNAPLMAKFNDEGESEAIRGLAAYTNEIRERFVKLAISYNINIITGSMPLIKEEDGRLYNVGFLCRRDGTYEMYEKIHVTPDEIKSWGLSGGKSLQTFDTDCAKIGVLICYDVEFPELSRIMADQGMQILFVPFLTDTQNAYSRVKVCAHARAIENECFVVIAGSVGNLPRVHNMDIQYAQSGVFTPCDFAFPTDGKRAEATPNTEMILVSDVDLDLLNELHTYGSVRNLKDRRNDLYEVKMKK